MHKTVNPFTVRGNWYKANLHTHTTVSDGALSPAERVEQYREAGYSVLAITDTSKPDSGSRAGATVSSGRRSRAHAAKNPANCPG